MSDLAISPARRPSEAERRDRILEAAERVFIERGFHAATMHNIAEAAGMSAGNLYRTFPSKEAIVEGLCLCDQEQRVEAFMNLAGSKSMLAAFEGSLHEMLALKSPEKARLLVEIWAEATRNPAISAISVSVDADILGRITHVFEIAKQRGEAAADIDSTAAARFIFTYVGGLLKRLAIEPDFDGDAEAGRAFQLVKALCSGAFSPNEPEATPIKAKP